MPGRRRPDTTDERFSSVLGPKRGRPAAADGQPTEVTLSLDHLEDGCHVGYQIFRGSWKGELIELARDTKIELLVGDGLRFECDDPSDAFGVPEWAAWVVTGNPRDDASFERRICRVRSEGVVSYFAYCPDERCGNAWPLGSNVPARCPEHNLHVAFGFPASN